MQVFPAKAKNGKKIAQKGIRKSWEIKMGKILKICLNQTALKHKLCSLYWISHNFSSSWKYTNNIKIRINHHRIIGQSVSQSVSQSVIQQISYTKRDV